jgi:hypothetical protein
MFDKGLSWDDLILTPEPNPEEIDAFEQEGVSLWRQLREELAPFYTVIYQSLKYQKVFMDPEELDKP